MQPGTRLGPYQIAAMLGSGGMGEVYRARDTRLNRDVAIKILPDSVVHDPDRLARFEREAKVLAALNHALIAHVYGFEESNGRRAIVMELVEGSTLEARIAQGPIPVPEVLHIARQLAEALETAHELGIVHRDLKPANVKVTSNDTVKVLDFGLAKALDTTAHGSVDALNSPTLTARATELGTILGTAAYMAPEQARGKAVDRRADVWAFGVVCVEMLTGTRLFKGEDVSDTMAAVLRQPIDLSVLPAATPVSVRTLLERCLERDPRQRLRDIGEARVTLERCIAGGTTSTTVAEPARPVRAPRIRRLVPWLLFAVAAAALAAVLWIGRPQPRADAPALVTRVVSSIGVPGALAVDAGPAAVLSPDGRTIVLRVRRDGVPKLYRRHLDEIEPTELAGTDQATNPFFSPDGSQLGFFSGGGLKTIPIAGGATTTLTDAATGRGAAWHENGDIIFQSSLLPKTPLVRITASGATTDRGTTLESGEATHRWPQFLQGGRVLYSANSDVSAWDTGNLRVAAQPGVPGKIVLRGGYHGRYVPTGHLLYVHAGTLYAARFDLERLEVTSPATPVVHNVVATPSTGGAQYSIASDGTLAYVPGSATSVDGRMYWMTATGQTTPLKTTVGAWGNPSVSPDGKRIAMQVTNGSHDQIAIYDLEIDRLTQITSDASNHSHPIWTPDNRYVIYASDAGAPGTHNLYGRRADGSGEAVRLTTSPLNQTPGSVRPDGRTLAYVEFEGAGSDIWLLPLDSSGGQGLKPGTPRVFVKTPAFDALASFSPDGRLIAYMQSQGGGFEIYVKRVDGDGGPWRVSTSGGAHPVWAKKSKTLLYTIDDQLMSVPYQFDGRAFHPDSPRPWSTVRYATAGPTRKYDLHPDSTRAIVATPDTSGAATYDKFVLVFNFFKELERLLPAGAAPATPPR